MTIPHTTPSLEDFRLTLARQVLTELPEPGDNDQPWFWVGRLRSALQLLADGWPAGTPGGLSGEQKEVLASAIADAAEYREARAGDGFCADCETDPSNLCSDHAADFDLSCAYVLLAGELGLEAGR